MNRKAKILLINAFTLYPIGFIGLGYVTNWWVPVFIFIILTAVNIENRNK